MRRPIVNNTGPREAVFELFLGSSTTVGRGCRTDEMTRKMPSHSLSRTGQ
jgi:hypothetical protein